MRVETNEGVWSQLTTAFPQLTTMVLRTKKVRDAAAVKVSVSVQVQKLMCMLSCDPDHCLKLPCLM